MKNGEVAAHNQAGNQWANLGQKITKKGVKFRSSTGDIQGFNGIVVKKPEDIFYNPAGHLFGAIRTRIHMAMDAALIANGPQIHLERSNRFFLESRKLYGQYRCYAHRIITLE
jgi:hypothetical protein